MDNLVLDSDPQGVLDAGSEKDSLKINFRLLRHQKKYLEHYKMEHASAVVTATVDTALSYSGEKDQKDDHDNEALKMAGQTECLGSKAVQVPGISSDVLSEGVFPEEIPASVSKSKVSTSQSLVIETILADNSQEEVLDAENSSSDTGKIAEIREISENSGVVLSEDNS